jgi:hypothetical protein
VGLEPSTRQYRVMALSHAIPHKVYIVRHVVINVQHYTEFFARSAMLEELKRYVRIQPLTVLRAERASGVVIPANAISTQALSRGTVCAEHALDMEEVITPDKEREARAFEQYAENEAYDSKINRKRSTTRTTRPRSGSRSASQRQKQDKIARSRLSTRTPNRL